MRTNHQQNQTFRLLLTGCVLLLSEVWEKQTGGAWKCGTDIWNSGLAAAAEKK